MKFEDYQQLLNTIEVTLPRFAQHALTGHGTSTNIKRTIEEAEREDVRASKSGNPTCPALPIALAPSPTQGAASGRTLANAEPYLTFERLQKRDEAIAAFLAAPLSQTSS